MSARFFRVDHTTERKRPARGGLRAIDYCPECGRKAEVSSVTGGDGVKRIVYTHAATGRTVGGITFWTDHDWHIIKEGAQ